MLNFKYFIFLCLFCVSNCKEGTHGLVKDIIESVSAGVSCMTKTLSLGPDLLYGAKSRWERNSDLDGPGYNRNYDGSSCGSRDVLLNDLLLTLSQNQNEGCNSQNGGSASKIGSCSSQYGGCNSQSGYPSQCGGGTSQTGDYNSQSGLYTFPNGGYNSQSGGYTSPNGGYTPQSGVYTFPNGGYSCQSGRCTSPSGGYSSQSGGYTLPNGGCNSQSGSYTFPNAGYTQTGCSFQSPCLVSTRSDGDSSPVTGYTSSNYQGNYGQSSYGQSNCGQSGQTYSLLETPTIVCREEIDKDTQTKVIVCDTCYDSDTTTGYQSTYSCSEPKSSQSYQFGSSSYSQEKQGLGEGYQYGCPLGQSEGCQSNCQSSCQPSCQSNYQSSCQPSCQTGGQSESPQGGNCQVNRLLTLLRNQCDGKDTESDGGDQLNLHNQLIFNQYNNVIGSIGTCEPSDVGCQIDKLVRYLACGSGDSQCCRASSDGSSSSSRTVVVAAVPRGNQCNQDNQCNLGNQCNSCNNQVPRVIQVVAPRPVGGCPNPSSTSGSNAVVLANPCAPPMSQLLVAPPQGQISTPSPARTLVFPISSFSGPVTRIN